MPNELSIHINPNCFGFLGNIHAHKLASLSKKDLHLTLEQLHRLLNLLRNQPKFQFSNSQKNTEISRGAFYALTPSLLKRFLEGKKINLASLQKTFKEEFQILDPSAIDFMIMCLTDPVYLEFALHNLVNSLLVNIGYYSSNDSGFSDPDFKHILKAEKAKPTATDKSILFSLTLLVKNQTSKMPVGSTSIHFTITEKKQIKLELIPITFSFTNDNEANEFKSMLIKNFEDWILPEAELDIIKLRHQMQKPLFNFCVIPILVSFLFGLVAMICMLALSFTPLTSLILPLAGLGIGLILASLNSSYELVCRKKDKDKLRRPIYIFNNKQLTNPQIQRRQTSSFFRQDHFKTINAQSSEPQLDSSDIAQLRCA
ncbi:hypothetical protein [Rickettsiella endosymbiont of Rhagonycha lignosa]|uniref:hypothetical protein n=1 Tax=Rickettsiella endosymbiont of Rhagonycha lignosa TaxID=3077937 RepID=UPI00313D229B